MDQKALKILIKPFKLCPTAQQHLIIFDSDVTDDNNFKKPHVNS